MILNLMKINPLIRAGFKTTIRPFYLAGYVAQRAVQEFPNKRFDNRVRSDYVLVLPEQTKENSTNNELLRIPQVGQPENDFSKISVESAYKGLSRAVCSFENYLIDIDTADVPHDKSVKEVLQSIEEFLLPMDTAYNLLVALSYFKSDDFYHKELSDLIFRYHRVRESRKSGHLAEYFDTFSDIAYAELIPKERCLVHLYRGINPNIKKVNILSREMIQRQQQLLNEDTEVFRRNLNFANQLFKHTIDDPDLLAVMPSDFNNSDRLHHRERTPLQVTNSNYHKFMRVCPDRFIRQSVWATRNKRCSPKALPKLNNMSIISSIRTNRRKLSQLLGYRTHLEYRLSHTKAQTKQNVLEMLNSMNKENESMLKDRLQELNDFAADNMFEDPLGKGIQEYDVDYWSHRYTYEILIGRTEAEIRNFFPIEKVLHGLSKFFESSFKLEIKNITNRQSARMWHKDVQFLQVSLEGRVVGNVMLDLYHRPNKILTEPCQGILRGRSEKFNCLPARFISTSFKSSAESQVKLNLIDVINLFYCYSSAIQGLLYNSGYYELDTSELLEPDVINLFSNVCMEQILTDHRILQSFSDRGSSKPIDSDLAGRMIKGLSYFRSFDTWRELYKAHLDIEAHTILSDIRAMAASIYKFYSPFERDPDDYDFCAMSEIFAGPNEGLQYAQLWSRQLAKSYLPDEMNHKSILVFPN